MSPVAGRLGRAVVGALAWTLVASACGGRGASYDAHLAGPSTTARAAPTTVPSDPAIADLMDGAGMAPPARQLFLNADPRIEPKDTLARSCAGVFARAEPGSVHTYGCVVDGKVHVRDFSRPEMHDFKYVVAAHELLHLVYARLSMSDRARIDSELQAARFGNEVLEQRLEVYTNGSADTLSEVHSVLGSELAGLSPGLESHFSRYFDRGRVTAAFEATLGGRERELRRLRGLAEQIEGRLESMEPQLDALRRSGSVRAYNATVADYNAVVDEHNAVVAQLRALVADYEELTGS